MQGSPLDLERLAGPAVAPVPLAELKRQLRVYFDDDDDTILEKLDEAVDHLDGPEGLLSACMVEQTWIQHLPRFPGGWPFRQGFIELLLPPLIAVDEILYLDTDGAVQTLSPSLYSVLTGQRAEIHLARGQRWPATDCHPRAVSIEYRCGYAAAGGTEEAPTAPDPGDVPAAYRSALKLIVGDLYENREGQTIAGGTLTAITNETLKRLLRLKRTPHI